MAANSKIEWTDHTWNPWLGCAHAVLADGTEHPGCQHCYAESMARRNPTVLGVWGMAGAGGTRVMAALQTFIAPLRWNEAAKAAGVRHRVFVDSMCDLFEDWPGTIVNHRGENLISTMDEVRQLVFAIFRQCAWLDFLILTKRPTQIPGKWPTDLTERLNNVWLGTSISDQRTADALVPQLLLARDLVPVLFLSCEPLLGPIDLSAFIGGEHMGLDGPVPNYNAGIDWVIAGGESGPHARPMHPDWARSLRDQCQAAAVPFFFKQWGEWSAETVPGTAVDLETLRPNQCVAAGDLLTNHTRFTRVGKKAAGRLLDGREWNEFPVP